MLQALWLKILIVIQGLGAASGIIFYKNQIFTISDDKTSIFQYNLKTRNQEIIPLNTSVFGEKITKNNKLDFESIVLINDELLCLGSGSKANRNEMTSYNLKTKVSTSYDLTELYQKIRTRFSIEPSDFNIEGFAYHNGETYLFNRGNGKNRINAIFRFKGLPHLLKSDGFWIKSIDLPIINGNQTTFSDAIIVDNQIIYTATIEVDSSVQADGSIKESIIGAIDLPTFTLKNYQIIATNQKIEGITLRKKSLRFYHFLLCEDNDNEETELSKIYELKISKDLSVIE